MGYREDIAKELSEVVSAGGSIDAKTGEGALHKLSGHLSALQKALREQVQVETGERIRGIVVALAEGTDPGPEDMEFVRLWLVGDAEHYTRAENDYPNWLRELARLVSGMGRLRGESLTLEPMGRLSGMVRDALRVIPDIAYFKRQEERVRSFEQASRALTQESREALVRILKKKLTSDRW